jgi:sulfide:quinone oxidoreductase
MAGRPQIVILGGGFAGLRAFWRLDRDLGSRASLVVVDPRETSLEKPLLPEVAFAGKPVEHARIPLGPVVARHGGRFVNRRAEGIDPARGEVALEGGERLSYDYLLIAVGAVKAYDAIPGYREYGYSICDDTEAPRLAEALRRFRGGPVVSGSARSAWGRRVRVPALAAPCEGPVGETVFMVDHELRRRGLRASSPLTAFSPGRIFFEDVGPNVHAAVEPLLRRHEIPVRTGAELARLEAHGVVFTDGSSLESALSIVIPPYAGAPVVRDSGLGDEAGFVPTDDTMRHLDHPTVYAAGDGTALAMPKLGHLAVMQADIAAAAIRKAVTGTGDIPPYRPEIFCIMHRGGEDATLILSNTLYGGQTDLTLSGPVAHLMKWGFDSYYFYTRGHMPPDTMAAGMEAVLRRWFAPSPPHGEGPGM